MEARSWQLRHITTRPTQPYGFDALAIDDCRTWLGLTPHHKTYPLSKNYMNLLLQAIPPPEAKIVVHSFSGRQIVEKQTPCTPTSQHIEDYIENFTRAMKLRTPMSCRSREKRSDAVPFRIA
jgi:hypothetical protein